MPNIVQSLRSVARLPFVRGNRPPIHTISVNIDLAFYNGAVPYANRTDRHFLNEVVPKVLADLEEAIEARFTIAGHSHSISNMRPTCTFELTNRAAITATVFDSRVSLQAFTNNRKVARSLRRLLTDFKLRKNYKYDTAELAKNLSPSFSGRRRRIRIAKIMSEVPDPRFIPVLQRALRDDTSGSVRRHVVRTLGLLMRAGYEVDLTPGLGDSDKDARTLAQAFLQGNRFVAGRPAAFIRDLGETLPEEKIAGTFLGGAVADMMGYPIEFRTRDEIAQLYGGPVTGLVLSKSRTIDFGQFSDDTELPLMMAFAIDPQHGFNPSLFAQYLAEHVYQIDTFGVPNFGYGINTMRAARNLYSGVVWNRSGLNHSTCSPAIRMSPLGLYFHSDFDALEEAAVVAGNITHANHIAVAGGVAVALAVAKLVAGSGQFESSSLMDWLQPEVAAHDEELADKLELAAGLAADAAVSDEQAYERLGNSSETREIVPLAFYAFLRTPHDYEETVLRAINAGGDADSAGSIAGSLSGALNGVSAIPETWIHHLRNRSLVYRAIGHLGAFV